MASQMRGFPFEFFLFSKQYTFFSTLFPKSVLQKSVLDLKKVQKCTIVQKKCKKKGYGSEYDLTEQRAHRKLKVESHQLPFVTSEIPQTMETGKPKYAPDIIDTS